MNTSVAKLIGILLQGSILGVSLYLAIVMLWVQAGQGQIFQYQGF